MFRRLALAMAALAATAVCVIGPSGRPAAAAVAHGRGFAASVLGWRSWYGSYEIAGLGTVWCVDHGIPAPDGGFDYQPAVLGERAPATRAAMAWALGRFGPGADAVDAAALMLVMHDLMGARYPRGGLHVDQLRPGDLTGFGGHEGEVLARAKAMRAEAVAHGSLVSPLALTVTSPAVRPGAPAVISVGVRDGAGAGVEGVVVRVAGTDVTTGPGGQANIAVPAVEGENRFDADADTPDLDLRSYAPRRAVAQRVARPSVAHLHASAGFTAVPRRRLTIHKIGDDDPYLPVAGASFTVDGQQVTAGPDGLTPAVELEPGRYEIVETAPPPGYQPGGPWPVDISADEVTVEARDHAVTGAVAIEKVDDTTGRPVPGAALALAFDSDRDGTYETALGTVVSGPDPVRRDGLLPGDYEVTETSPPAGYRPAPSPVRVTVAPGSTEMAEVRDAPIPPAPPPAEVAPPAPPPPPSPLSPPAAVARTPTVLARPAPELPATGRPLPAEAAAGLACCAIGTLFVRAGRPRRSGGRCAAG